MAPDLRLRYADDTRCRCVREIRSQAGEVSSDFRSTRHTTPFRTVDSDADDFRPVKELFYCLITNKILTLELLLSKYNADTMQCVGRSSGPRTTDVDHQQNAKFSSFALTDLVDVMMAPHT